MSGTCMQRMYSYHVPRRAPGKNLCHVLCLNSVPLAADLFSEVAKSTVVGSVAHATSRAFRVMVDPFLQGRDRRSVWYGRIERTLPNAFC